MAKFIELPYGEYNNETKKTERTQKMVNLDRVLEVQPSGEFASMVTITGGKKIVVYRRYDTLRAQITGRQDLMESYPDEEVSAAFDSGYQKGRFEGRRADDHAHLIKKVVKAAYLWFESNPMSNGWQGKFRRDLTAQLMSEPIDDGSASEDDTETF